MADTYIPPEAISALQTFLNAILQNDLPSMHACLTQKPSHISQPIAAQPLNYILGKPTIEGDAILIPVYAYSLETPPNDKTPATDVPCLVSEMPCVMVQQDGHWKLDLIATALRLLTNTRQSPTLPTAASLGTPLHSLTQSLGTILPAAFNADATPGNEDAADDDSDDDEDDDEYDDEDTDGQTPDTPPLSDSAQAQARNDANFRSAVESLKTNEPLWSQQLEMVFQRPIPLTLDFESLYGNYDLIQPFIHQALTATLEALTQIAFDPACTRLKSAIPSVTISAAPADAPFSANLSLDTLAIAIPLQIANVPPPTTILATLLRLAQLSEHRPHNYSFPHPITPANMHTFFDTTLST